MVSNFVKNRSCENSLISFSDGVSVFVVKGETGDVIYLDFSVSFCTLSHDMLLGIPVQCCPGETVESQDTGLEKTILRGQPSPVHLQLDHT